MNIPSIIEFSNERVLTTQQLAEVYETDVNNIQKNFSNNKKRFIEGKHYHLLVGEELKTFKQSLPNDIQQAIKFAPQLILWTEKGADRHCKILDTNKAWEQFDNLEETYFRVKEMKKEPRSLEEIVAQGLIAAQSIIKEQKNKIEELEPLANYCKLILKNKGLVNITQIAKDYGMTANEMNDRLHKMKIQYKSGKQWVLYREYHDKGYVHSETFDFKHKDGTEDVSMLTKWTQKGRMFLYDRLKEEGIIPVIERGTSK